MGSPVRSRYSNYSHTRSNMFIKSSLAVALLCGVQAAPQLPPQAQGFNGDPSLARILQEQRFNMGDGKFGAAYAQEDGVAFKEESTGNNERIGQYSYLDENGNTIVVKYSAGVNGFRILDGAHTPSGGQTSAQAQVTDEAGEPKEYEYEYYDDTPLESPFVNPHDPNHQNAMLKAGDLAGLLAHRVFTTTPAPLPGQPTPSAPQRFFPKGQIKLDRFPQGFNFQFQS